MNLANLFQRVVDGERRVKQMESSIESLKARVSELENRRGPGRPRKVDVPSAEAPVAPAVEDV